VATDILFQYAKIVIFILITLAIIIYLMSVRLSAPLWRERMCHDVCCGCENSKNKRVSGFPCRKMKSRTPLYCPFLAVLSAFALKRGIMAVSGLNKT
jgi:hypothetical protein